VKGRAARYYEPKRPALAKGEHAIYLNVEVPDSVFAPKLASAIATITVPEEKVMSPAVLVEVSEPPEENQNA
jgi:hypothetical protein